jgi:hypothetical protein
MAGGRSTQAIQQWVAGMRPIDRDAAWKLTRAAWRFGVELPPVGMVGYRKGAWSKERPPLAPEHEARRPERLKESKWTLDQLMVLGTMPDRVVAEHLGRTRRRPSPTGYGRHASTATHSFTDEERLGALAMQSRCTGNDPERHEIARSTPGQSIALFRAATVARCPRPKTSSPTIGCLQRWWFLPLLLQLRRGVSRNPRPIGHERPQ